MVLTELFVTMAFVSRFWFDRKLTDLRDARMQKESVIDGLSQAQAMFLKTQSQLSTIKNIFERSLDPGKRLETVRSLTPTGIEYSQIDFSPEAITLRGFSTTAAEFSSLLTNIQNFGGFSEIATKRLKLSTFRRPGFDFEVEMKIKNDSEAAPAG